MILDFGSFTRKGLLVDLERPVEIWVGDISQTEQGAAGRRGDGRRQKDH